MERRDQPLFDLDEVEPQSAAEALFVDTDEQPPATRFQIDCTDALVYIDGALRSVAPKEQAESVIANMYLQLAEAVQSLGAQLRFVSDARLVNYEVMQAKASIFELWMKSMSPNHNIFRHRWLTVCICLQLCKRFRPQAHPRHHRRLPT
jgi:hypothetical protein